MNWKNTQARYGMVSIGIHWAMLVLLIATYSMILLHGQYPRSERGAMFESWHSMLGLTVLLLVLIRIPLRLMQVAPQIVPPAGKWQHLSAKLMHLALFLLMLVMPILGWALLSAEGHEVIFWGLPLPGLVEQNRDLANTIKEVHETIGNIGYFLIGLHAAAALYHHYYLRDDTLLRMLPVSRKNRQ